MRPRCRSSRGVPHPRGHTSPRGQRASGRCCPPAPTSTSTGTSPGAGGLGILHQDPLWRAPRPRHGPRGERVRGRGARPPTVSRQRAGEEEGQGEERAHGQGQGWCWGAGPGWAKGALEAGGGTGGGRALPCPHPTPVSSGISDAGGCRQQSWGSAPLGATLPGPHKPHLQPFCVLYGGTHPAAAPAPNRAPRHLVGVLGTGPHPGGQRWAGSRRAPSAGPCARLCPGAVAARSQAEAGSPGGRASRPRCVGTRRPLGTAPRRSLPPSPPGDRAKEGAEVSRARCRRLRRRQHDLGAQILFSTGEGRKKKKEKRLEKKGEKAKPRDE